MVELLVLSVVLVVLSDGAEVVPQPERENTITVNVMAINNLNIIAGAPF
jgi:hypothetical protein